MHGGGEMHSGKTRKEVRLLLYNFYMTIVVDM